MTLDNLREERVPLVFAHAEELDDDVRDEAGYTVHVVVVQVISCRPAAARSSGRKIGSCLG
jgi:hypothetical protein